MSFNPAGCEQEDILNHCRGDEPHVRVDDFTSTFRLEAIAYINLETLELVPRRQQQVIEARDILFALRDHDTDFGHC